MRSHKFINSLLYLIIQLVAKESIANKNNGGIRCFFVLFIDKRYISHVIHFKGGGGGNHVKEGLSSIQSLQRVLIGRYSENSLNSSTSN